MGGSRNAGDAARVEGLRALAKELEIEVRVLCSLQAMTLRIERPHPLLASCRICDKRSIPAYAQVVVPSQHRDKYDGG